MHSLRSLAPSVLALTLLLSACSGGDDRAAGTGDSMPAAAPLPAGAAPATAPAATSWAGPHDVRGTIEGGRSVTGVLDIAPLDSGAAEFARTSARVRSTYPAYAGPYFSARLALAAGAADSILGTFGCANGPASTPPLVCDPVTPIKGLENATLVMQPDGRAILTGSHGEGVTIEYGRFSWSRRGS